jgi:hypothetical protein
VAALELVDGVLEVAPGIDAKDEAVVDQGVGLSAAIMPIVTELTAKGCQD